MGFDSTTTTQKKKSYADLALEYYPYWVPYFEHIGHTNPAFKTKLCYNSKEFTPKTPAIRFFESELDSGHDVYIECTDWDSNFYDPMNRTLYKLAANPNWKSETDKYVQSNNTKHVTYAVKLSDLEMVNQTSITEGTPLLIKSPAIAVDEDEQMSEEEYYSSFSDKDDTHLSAMTIRDQYCITHEVPLSTKPWLNELILKGRKWKKENQL